MGSVVIAEDREAGSRLSRGDSLGRCVPFGREKQSSWVGFPSTPVPVPIEIITG